MLTPVLHLMVHNFDAYPIYFFQYQNILPI